jgi:membrane protein DedA with SNARE-associated domain
LAEKIDAQIAYLASQGAFWIYLFLFFSSFVENLFPPYPADVVTLTGAYFLYTAGLSIVLGFVLVVIGGLSSVVILYLLGRNKGVKLFQKERGPFLNMESLQRIESWFSRHGEKVLLVSRFMAGIRTVIAVGAGVGGVRPGKMVTYSAISFVLWNFVLFSLAYLFRTNFEAVVRFVEAYSTTVLVGAVLLVVGGITYMRIKKRNPRGKSI